MKDFQFSKTRFSSNAKIISLWSIEIIKKVSKISRFFPSIFHSGAGEEQTIFKSNQYAAMRIKTIFFVFFM